MCYSQNDYQNILDFTVAACCTKHTIPGDFNLASVDEIDSVKNKAGYLSPNR